MPLYAENPLNFAPSAAERETRIRSLRANYRAPCILDKSQIALVYILASQKTLDRLFELVIGLKLKTQTAAKIGSNPKRRRKRHFCASLIPTSKLKTTNKDYLGHVF